MLKFAGRQLAELYRRGFALFLLAPLIIAFATVPEFLQHIAEIHIGMFHDLARARAVANDPLRWDFGYLKLAGLALAMFASARFWGVRERGGVWWRLGDVAWVRFALALVLFLCIPLVVKPIEPMLPDAVGIALSLALSLASLPFLFPALAALFGDRAVGLMEGYRRGWRWLPLLVLLLVAGYGPPFAAHFGLHRLALGRPEALVWVLMAVDAMVVGLLASLTGAAFALGYRAGFPAAAEPR